MLLCLTPIKYASNDPFPLIQDTNTHNNYLIPKQTQINTKKQDKHTDHKPLGGLIPKHAQKNKINNTTNNKINSS